MFSREATQDVDWNDASRHPARCPMKATSVRLAAGPRIRGFTLIELLVVIAIISLLVSILLPSLSRAKDITKGVLCMSNFKQIGLALTYYADENDGYLPQYSWQPPVAAFMELPGPPFPLGCPSKPWGTDPPGYWVSRPWACNLSVNRWLDDDAIAGGSPSNAPGYWTMAYAKVPDPLGTTLVFDAMLCSEMTSSLPPYSPEYCWGWNSADYRHVGGSRGKCNILFVDLHVDSFDEVRQEMWTPYSD